MSFIENIIQIISDKELNGVIKRFEVGRLLRKEYPEGISDSELTQIAKKINVKGYSKTGLRDFIKLNNFYEGKESFFEEYGTKLPVKTHIALAKNNVNNHELAFYVKKGLRDNWSNEEFSENIEKNFYQKYLSEIKKTDYKFEIENIKIKNYKALVDLEIDKPDNFLVFVGANGAGKTTIFEALDFFNHSYKVLDDEVFNIFGSEENIINYNQQEKGINNFEIKIQLTDDLYKVKFDGRTLKKDNLLNKKFITSFSRIFIDNTKRAKNRLNSRTKLNLDAENIAKILSNIFKNEDAKNDFLSQIGLFVPGLKNIDVVTDQLTGKSEILVYEKATKKPFKGTLISEGTYYIMALLALIYQTEEQQFICIEEPEVGLNPYVLKELVKFFREITKEEKNYIWISTHSPTLISLLQEEELIIVNKDKKTGQTKLLQYKKGDFNGKRADEAWLTNELKGGLPW